MTVLESPIPRIHLVHRAIPSTTSMRRAISTAPCWVCPQGRSAETWVDWNLQGHQLVTHLAPRGSTRAHAPVDGHDVPVPHFGLLLSVTEFHRVVERCTPFVIEPYLHFDGQTGEQRTMFLLDPAGNALEFKAFADASQVFAVDGGR